MATEMRWSCQSCELVIKLDPLISKERIMMKNVINIVLSLLLIVSGFYGYIKANDAMLQVEIAIENVAAAHRNADEA